MGSFHQHRLMNQLSEAHTVYGIDYLGQGQSWPLNCQDGTSENEKDLQYSGSLWKDQIIEFIDQTIGGHVHLVGNSVGGHLAAFIAAERPDLVETVILLNATPVWGLNLPGWSGHLPAPRIPKFVSRKLFDNIRSMKTIRSFLEETYVHHDAYDDVFMEQVRSCTDGPGGHAAFASILWSPPIGNFYDSLAQIQCDTLLCFGDQDPWCKPAFARRMLESLSKRQAASRYLEISNCGHCPNHESPTAVATILERWIKNKDRKIDSLLDEQPTFFKELWGETPAQERSMDDIKMNLIDRLAVKFI